jgi:acyl-CoA synthetase (AMP-forming)/AMP-acid ligase II
VVTERPGSADNYVVRVLELFADYGDQEAIVQGDSRLTYREVADLTLGLARLLHEQGIGPGSAVAMLVKDHLASASLQLALHLLGCRTVWIAAYAPPRDQADFFRLSQSEVLIYSASGPKEQLAADLSSQASAVRVFSLGPGSRGMDLIAALPAGPPEFDPALVGPDPESLFYTGGTTGLPKLIQHGQGFYKTLLAIAAYYVAAGEPPMRFLSGSSFSHVSGQMPAFLTLFEGGTLFLADGWDPGRFLAAIERERVSSTFLTPAQLYRVLDHPAVATTQTSSLRYLNVGGAPASPTRLAEAIALFGPVLRLVYGSSEAPLITDLPFLDHDPDRPDRLSSCGRPFADTRIEIRDDRGEALPVGETGEVWIAGSLRMVGYWRQPDRTSATIVAGWLRTGDVGYLDAEGYLYLVDRVSDMIVTGGAAANVYARPIEDVLTSHPHVKSAAVIGVPDAAYGEAVHAFVVTTPGADVTADELRRLVRSQLNNLYAPRDIEFVGSLPLTALAKVDKKLLRARYLAETGASQQAGR